MHSTFMGKRQGKMAVYLQIFHLPLLDYCMQNTIQISTTGNRNSHNYTIIMETILQKYES